MPVGARRGGGGTASTKSAGHQAQDHSQHDHSQHAAAQAGDDPHAHHRAMMGQKGYQRSEHAYPLKDFELVSMAGADEPAPGAEHDRP